MTLLIEIRNNRLYVNDIPLVFHAYATHPHACNSGVARDLERTRFRESFVQTMNSEPVTCVWNHRC